MSRPGRGSRRPDWGRLLLDLYACFLIPAYTILFAGKVKWFTTNFSVIAVMGADQFRGFVYWGVLVGLYFLVMLFKLSRTLPRKLLLRVLTLLAVLGLIQALILPYLPEYLPRVSRLHVMLAFSACAILMVCILLVLLQCRRREPKRYRPLLWAWGLIVAVSAVLFLMAGIISSALEIFFVISTTLLVRRLWLYRREEPF